jgi:hypothetical protein
LTKYFVLAVLALVLGAVNPLGAQVLDSTKPRIRVDSLPRVDSPVVQNRNRVESVMRLHSPKKAAIRSAILPGLGQIYNKRYWKLPLVYGALGVTAGIFIYNLTNYNDFRFAYRARVEAAAGDSTLYRQLAPEFTRYDVNAIRTYRDEFRQNMDYSALFFILFWGLNVVDAAVDAHLKAFDVSPDLSLRFRFGPSKMAGTTGISLVLAFK